MMATEPVRALKLVTINGKRNSFQLKMKLRMNAARRPGPESGRMIRAMIEGRDAPSSAALSISSRGISSRNVRMTQIARGISNPVNRMMSARRVSMSPIVLSMSWIGMSVVTGGNMRGSRIRRNRSVLPLNSRKLNVSAARPPRTSVPTDPSVDVTRLFQIGNPRPLATKSRYRSRVGQKKTCDRSIKIRSGLIESITR